MFNSIFLTQGSSNGPGMDALIGGEFTTYKGNSANKIIKLENYGDTDAGFDYGSGFSGGDVYTITKDSSGKYYVGGSFTSYKGVACNKIIKLNADGSVDTSYNSTLVNFGVSGVIYVIKIDNNGKLLVGGSFQPTNVDFDPFSPPRTNIIRINTDGSPDLSFAAIGPSGQVFDIGLEPTTNNIYLVGNISYGSPTVYYGIQKLQPNGTVIEYLGNFGASIAVNKIIVNSDSTIYCGGAFTTYRGTAAKGIVKILANGNRDTSFASSNAFEGGPVNSIVKDANGDLYVTGSFTSFETLPQQGIIKIDDTCTKDASFDIGDGFLVIGQSTKAGYTIVINNENNIVIGGTFRAYKGTTADYFVVIKPNGNIAPYYSQLNAPVRTIAL